MPVVYLPDDRMITLDQRLGFGDEGEVWTVEGNDDVCVKVYWPEHLTAERSERIQAMVGSDLAQIPGLRDDHVLMTWPAAPVYDDQRTTVGFVQHRLNGSRHAPLGEMFAAPGRVALFEQPSWFKLLTIGSRIARAIDVLHAHNITVGDLSHNNIFARDDELVTFIDCDSMQFPHPSGNRIFPATRVTRDYIAPEVIAGGTQHVSQQSDRFLLAILICQLLMEGQHPFEGVPKTQAADETTNFNIQHQNNRITHPERLIQAPGLIPTELLPHRVRELAQQCFGPGHFDSSARPTGKDWYEAIDRSVGEVRGCTMNRFHFVHNGYPSCFWCDQLDVFDHFPSPERISQLQAAAQQTQTQSKPASDPVTSAPTNPVPPPSQPTASSPDDSHPATAVQTGPPDWDLFEWSTWPTWAKVALVVIVLVILGSLG